jgi:hypothetical protein
VLVRNAVRPVFRLPPVSATAHRLSKLVSLMAYGSTSGFHGLDPVVHAHQSVTHAKAPPVGGSNNM